MTGETCVVLVRTMRQPYTMPDARRYRAVNQARRRFGDGWLLMSAEIREMAVSYELMGLLFSQVYDVGDQKASSEVLEYVKEVSKVAYRMLGNDVGYH